MSDPLVFALYPCGALCLGAWGLWLNGQHRAAWFVLSVTVAFMAGAAFGSLMQLAWVHSLLPTPSNPQAAA